MVSIDYFYRKEADLKRWLESYSLPPMFARKLRKAGLYPFTSKGARLLLTSSMPGFVVVPIAEYVVNRGGMPSIGGCATALSFAFGAYILVRVWEADKHVVKQDA